MKRVHNTDASENCSESDFLFVYRRCAVDWPDGVLPSGQRRLLSGMRYSTAGIFSALSAYPGNTLGVQRLAGAISNKNIVWSCMKPPFTRSIRSGTHP